MTAEGEQLRVLVVDDDRLIRAGLRAILDSADGISVVGEAEDGAAAVSAARRLSPDVAVVDVRMPRVDGIEATRQLVKLRPAVAVLIVTTFDLDEYVHAALRAGASGFLLKDTPEDRLIAAVRMLPSGTALLDPRVTLRLVQRFSPPPSPSSQGALRDLTSREREVLIEVARGCSNDQVARNLNIAETTVKTHVSRILGKLNLVTRVQAVVVAYETGLVLPGHQRPRS